MLIRLAVFLAVFAIVAPVVVALIATGLTRALASAAPLTAVLRRPSRGPALRFGVDTFAFRNDSRIHHRGKPDLYANWCFVIARAVVQFQRFARFEPDAPRDVEKAVKAGLRGRLWTLVHWSNWRMVFPHPHGQQERVAAEAVSELQGGRPVQLFITDFPWIKLNHSVLAYDYTERAPDIVDFTVFGPNDPQGPGVVRFDCRAQRFRPAPLCGVAVPQFRAFRQYCSPLY